jgi:hypothetical protein
VTEWNPIMAALIDRDVHLFAQAKTDLTGAGVFVLASLVDRPLFPRIQQRVRVRDVLNWLLLAYIILVGYHFALVLIVTLG